MVKLIKYYHYFKWKNLKEDEKEMLLQEIETKLLFFPLIDLPYLYKKNINNKNSQNIIIDYYYLLDINKRLKKKINEYNLKRVP